MKTQIHRTSRFASGTVRFLVVAVLVMLQPSGCDQSGGSGGFGFEITSKPNAAGAKEITLQFDATGENLKTSTTFPVRVLVTGVADGTWTTNPMTQGVTVRLAAAGVAWPDEVLKLEVAGKRPTEFGYGGSQSATMDLGKGPVAVNVYTTGGAAVRLRSIVGATESVWSVGDNEVVVGDNQIRGIAKLMRELDEAAK